MTNQTMLDILYDEAISLCFVATRFDLIQDQVGTSIDVEDVPRNLFMCLNCTQMFAKRLSIFEFCNREKS